MNKRGDKMQEGGVFVGLTSAGVEWVAYKEADFLPMCERFDALEARKAAKAGELVRVKGLTAIQIGRAFEAGQGYCEANNKTIRDGKTFIEASRDVLEAIAEDLRIEAEHIGGTVDFMDCITDAQIAFAESAVQRSLLSTAKKIEKALAK
jgi:hypothetical protein